MHSPDEQKRGQKEEKWEKVRYFSICDLLMFNLNSMGICCCLSQRRKRKMRFYRICKSTFEDRTDIVNIMKTVADVDSIKEVIFDPHQIRLLPYLGNLKDDTDANIEKMSTDEAVTKLLQKKEPEYTHSKREMDRYLQMYLPDTVLKPKEMERLNTDEYISDQLRPK